VATSASSPGSAARPWPCRPTGSPTATSIPGTCCSTGPTGTVLLTDFELLGLGLAGATSSRCGPPWDREDDRALALEALLDETDRAEERRRSGGAAPVDRAANAGRAADHPPEERDRNQIDRARGLVREARKHAAVWECGLSDLRNSELEVGIEPTTPALPWRCSAD
jgi:hypothetical protein